MRRVVSAPYGSSFLKFNAKALDHDYMCVFDLGVLVATSAREQAQELIERVNMVMRAITKANHRLANTAALYVYDSGPVDRNGDLQLSPEAVGLIEKQFDALKTGKAPRLAFPDAQGRLVPAEIYPREIVLPVNTRLKMATNTVLDSQPPFRLLRDISFQIFFSVGVQINGAAISVNVSPLYEKRGSPIPMFEAVPMNESLSQQDSEVYQRKLLHLPIEQAVRQTSIDLYLASLQEYQAGNYLKQLKRLHGSYNGLRPIFSRLEQGEIESLLKTWLQSDWAIFAADINEQADMWLKTDATMAATFADSGSLNVLAEFLQHALISITSSQPQLAGDLDELKLVVEQLRQGLASPSLFQKLKAASGRLQPALQPPAQAMSRLLDLFSRRFKELGFSALNIYGIQDDLLMVSKHEIGQAGFLPEAVNRPPEEGGLPKIGGYDYLVIDGVGAGEEPLKTLLLRSTRLSPPIQQSPSIPSDQEYGND